jgi:hypothetical protein
MQARLYNFALLQLAVVLTPALPLVAQSASFIVSQHGKAVGTATVNVAARPDGFDTTTVVRVAMQGLDYSISKTEQLTRDNQLRHVQLSATINGSAVNVVAAPGSSQILLNISANGRSTTTGLAQHAAAVFLPDFDPGAFDTLLALAVTHNNRDLWAIIPKKDGSIQAIQLTTYADEKGTLDSRPITVHHLVATIAGAQTDLFSGSENQLLQAELPQQGFALIRRGFVLAPPTKPGAPPAQ